MPPQTIGKHSVLFRMLVCLTGRKVRYVAPLLSLLAVKMLKFLMLQEPELTGEDERNQSLYLSQGPNDICFVLLLLNFPL